MSSGLVTALGHPGKAGRVSIRVQSGVGPIDHCSPLRARVIHAFMRSSFPEEGVGQSAYTGLWGRGVWQRRGGAQNHSQTVEESTARECVICPYLRADISSSHRDKPLSARPLAELSGAPWLLSAEARGVALMHTRTQRALHRLELCKAHMTRTS